MDREDRNKTYQPIWDFLTDVVKINPNDFDVVKKSDDKWFEDFAFSITMHELMALYWIGIQQGRDECIQITDDLEKEAVDITFEWTPLGIIEECGDMIRELPQWKRQE